MACQYAGVTRIVIVDSAGRDERRQQYVDGIDHHHAQEPPPVVASRQISRQKCEENPDERNRKPECFKEIISRRSRKFIPHRNPGSENPGMPIVTPPEPARGITAASHRFRFTLMRISSRVARVVERNTL